MFTFPRFIKSVLNNFQQTSFNQEVDISKYIHTGSDNSNDHNIIQRIIVRLGIIRGTQPHLIESDMNSDYVRQSGAKEKCFYEVKYPVKVLFVFGLVEAVMVGVEACPTP